MKRLIRFCKVETAKTKPKAVRKESLEDKTGNFGLGFTGILGGYEVHTFVEYEKGYGYAFILEVVYLGWFCFITKNNILN